MECKNGVCTLGSFEEVVLRKAINTFGEKPQQLRAIRSLNNLSAALSDILINNENEIEEKIAEANIMLEQLTLIFNSSKVEKIKEAKIKELFNYVW